MRSTILLLLIVVAVTAPAHGTEPGEVIENSIGMKLAYIPPGRFTMGSPDTEVGRVSHEVTRDVEFATGFRIGVTEVTQAQWQTVMGTNPSFFKGDDRPVEHISWQDAIKYCQHLSQSENKRYRLPTEAEWEYACRAGTTTAYSAGDSQAALATAGWYRANGKNETHSVALKQPNEWGLYDMHGNVGEWIAERPEERKSDVNSARLDQEEKGLRDWRGGSWGLNANDCRSASRLSINGTFKNFDIGLRVVLELD